MSTARALLVEIRDLLVEVRDELRARRAMPTRGRRDRPLPSPRASTIEAVKRKLKRAGVDAA